MAVIECRQLRLPQSLRYGQDGGVDEADVTVGVPMADVTHALVVGRREVRHLVGTGRDILEKDHEYARMETLVNPIIHLDQNGGWDDEGFPCAFDELATPGVIRVAAIERRVQWSRVENQRHERGMGRRSPLSRAVSRVPESPTPRLRGRGR